MPLWQMADGERAIVVSWVRGSGSVSHSAVLEPNEIAWAVPRKEVGFFRDNSVAHLHCGPENEGMCLKRQRSSPV